MLQALTHTHTHTHTQTPCLSLFILTYQPVQKDLLAFHRIPEHAVPLCACAVCWHMNLPIPLLSSLRLCTVPASDVCHCHAKVLSNSLLRHSLIPSLTDSAAPHFGLS